MKGVIVEKCLRLLQANKNLILTGAPGTGKTYLAKQIAQQMLFGEAKDEEKLDDKQKAFFKEHCDFVQFHPSYDYTDFVEGLRPTLPSDNGQIGLKKGIFKEFCERALKAAAVSGVDNFDEAWKKLTDTIANEDEIAIPLNGRKKTRYGISGAVSLRFLDISAGTLTKNNVYNVYRGLKGRDSGAYQHYMQAAVNYMKKNCGLCDYRPDVISSSKQLKYVFIIDEINRGKISKIFGELFFLIDPEYRGEKGKVKTQYANLIAEGDIFYDGFFVPENVYIIGTMNDIDRSVERFDFAMRRRFVWQEITAEQSADNMHLPDSSHERMKHLNETISRIEGLNAAYHIGGAYFLKLEKGNGDYAKLWNHHIEPLLKEYLRGLPNAQDNLKSLENAYNLKHDG
ncbi:MAG: AAA family ATPase [Treponema sp.]|jgi:5-methylcytosine-specific restriction endonuclease McrBC GTP-binding regulatory subunit McrB|nr:AAA family ATPase [Treponema sp.]